MAGLLILGKPIIQILFQRGAFDVHSSVMTAYALFYYTLGLWAFSGVRIMVSAFYALQDTKTPVKVAVIALVVNLTLSLALMGPLKHGGLALALSLASSVQFLLLVLFLKKKTSVLNLRPVLISVSRSALAASLMGLGVYYFRSRWLSGGEDSSLPVMITNLAAVIIIGIIIYFGAARALGCTEIMSIMGMLSRRGKK